MICICGKISKKSGMNLFSREAGVNDGIKERRQEPPLGVDYLFI